MSVRKISTADARLRRLARDLRLALEEQPREHVTAVITSSLGDEQQPPAEVTPADPEKYWLHVEFDTRSPSVILPIIGVVTEYSRGMATITDNMKRRPR